LGDLVESSFNEVVEFLDQLQFVSSASSGGFVFLIQDVAEVSGVIPQLLVSLLLVGGGLRVSGLDGDASTQLFQLVGESGFQLL
jgi:hypothetical protein